MIKNFFIVLIAYAPFSMLFLASLLGKQVCMEIWTDFVNFLMF